MLALRIRLTTCWLLTNRVLKMFFFFLLLFLAFCRCQRFLYINLLSVHFFFLSIWTITRHVVLLPARIWISLTRLNVRYQIILYLTNLNWRYHVSRCQNPKGLLWLRPLPNIPSSVSPIATNTINYLKVDLTRCTLRRLVTILK